MHLYGAEAGKLLSIDAVALRTLERKVLCKLFGTGQVSDEDHIQSKSELYELLNDIDVEQHINIQRLRWIFDAEIYGGQRGERSCLLWKDQIAEALSSIGVINWRRHLE